MLATGGKSVSTSILERSVIISKLYGNTNGLKGTQLRQLERLYQRKIPAQQIITPELARQLVTLASDSNRQIGILVNRKGSITHVIVGNHHGLIIPELSGFRVAGTRLLGLRLIHVHLHSEPLTQDDLTDLALLRLDMIIALGIDKDHLPGKMFVAHLLPDNPEQKQWQLIEFSHPSQVSFGALELTDSLEEELSRKQKSLTVNGNGERAIVVSVSQKSKQATEESLLELQELARSCNITVLDRVVQYRTQLDRQHLLGKGKIQEVVIRSLQLGATLLIFDGELNPAQVKSITNLTDLKVIDRTQLILDIFAQRAQSRGGKVQVELAQLQYLLPRLVTKNTAMSRLTGGIGGRGPGETKLEINRRRVRDRIHRLEKEIQQLQKNRSTKRKMREKGGLPVISIVGYTNAGKSTLLNALTHSHVHTEDRLFATLDPTSRRLRFPHDTEAIITDTVGFMSDLPQELINAFRATLEELSQADVLLHVIDVSNPQFEHQMKACERILEDLNLARIPVLRVFNKQDQFPDQAMLKNLCRLYDAVAISALDSSTLLPLTEKIEAFFLARSPEDGLLRVTAAVAEMM